MYTAAIGEKRDLQKSNKPLCHKDGHMSNTGKCFSFMCGCGLQNISVQHSVLSYLGQFWILILSVPGNDHNLSNRGVMMQSK